jgi:exosortase H (IPTLxxWG-CTERM-specific)
MNPSSKKRLGFVLRFVLLIVALYFLIAWRPVDRAVITPLTRGIASVSAALLRMGDSTVVSSGTTLRNNRFAVEIKNACNGVEAMLLLLSAVIAFPAAWPARLRGIGLGILIIQGTNLLRVVSLFLIGLHTPRYFEFAHVVFWQSVMFLTTAVFFIYWVTRVAQRPSADA